MGYNQQSEFPRGLYHNTLASVRIVAGAGADVSNGGTLAPKIKVASIVVSGDAATVVKVSSTDDTREIMRIKMAADTTHECSIGFESTDGLRFEEIAGTTTNITVFYYKA